AVAPLLLLLVTLSALGVVANRWRSSVKEIRIEVRGARLVDSSTVIRLVHLPDSTCLADVNLLDVQSAVLTNPFIRKAEVYRDPPSTLVIEVTERVPVANILGPRGNIRPVDEAGYVLPASSVASGDLPLITGLPSTVVLRAGKRISVPAVRKALAIVSASGRIGESNDWMISEISIARQKNIVLFTTISGTPVIFGNAVNTERKLRSLETFWETIALKNDPRRLEYIDLRFKNQIVVRWKNDDQPSVNNVMKQL
ncbi:MAG: FtsQ-type POTRA domain-containing protein, partial [Chlorobi bacterium]|nr:FtsQ-type POTRA domain-containing protein [Chlorobiota bacterium]